MKVGIGMGSEEKREGETRRTVSGWAEQELLPIRLCGRRGNMAVDAHALFRPGRNMGMCEVALW